VNHSPYQHQDPRQLDLQQRIQQAMQHEDHQSLARLELQWVHRFGVQSLPSGFLTAEEPASPSMPEQEPEVTAVAPVEPARATEKEQQPTESAEPEPAHSGLNRFTSLLKNCLDDVGRVADSETAPEITADTSVPVLRPVPVSGPQRLRRWLTPVSQNDLPKAS